MEKFSNVKTWISPFFDVVVVFLETKLPYLEKRLKLPTNIFNRLDP